MMANCLWGLGGDFKFEYWTEQGSWLNCRAAPKPFKNNHDLGIANLAFDATTVKPAQVSVKTEDVPEYAAVAPSLIPLSIGVNLVRNTDQRMFTLRPHA
ncbi:hypothetical protein CEXT_576081 [Caerostris extrusa]|uniref:Uncharacterized protein n=1 Tax=Caerostris extrusa TaxID=172846 RepID=A0AAV4XQ77_CAEEX|nr:hypothetical protein CEXT_576081 [Caerostris extrusa]